MGQPRAAPFDTPSSHGERNHGEHRHRPWIRRRLASSGRLGPPALPDAALRRQVLRRPRSRRGGHRSGGAHRRARQLRRTPEQGQPAALAQDDRQEHGPGDRPEEEAPLGSSTEVGGEGDADPDRAAVLDPGGTPQDRPLEHRRRAPQTPADSGPAPGPRGPDDRRDRRAHRTVPRHGQGPAVPAETLGIAVETELEATSRWNQGFFTQYGFICIPEPCRGGWCCRITRF